MIVSVRRSNSNDTDETDCEMWPCLARYQHCDRYWNRPNGCDELQCSSLIQQKCADNEHPCARFNSTTMDCLPLAKAGDKHIDCLFGTDERKTLLGIEINGWGSLLSGVRFEMIYKLVPEQICDRERDCPSGDDELFCQ
jgi:hypothetical protein